MAGNTMTLDFAGDADKLQKAAKDAQKALGDVDKASEESGATMADQAQSTSRLEDRLGSLGSATTGATDAIDSLSAGMTALADIQDYSRAKADRLARAEIDVEQALIDSKQATIDLRQSRIDLRQANEDAAQSTLDVKQSEIDQKQATLDAKTAQDDYNKAVKEFGAGSSEAQQASIDLEQANQDLAQANADGRQASIDYKQAINDKAQAENDASQAATDAKESQLNLNSAMHEANPPALSEYAEMLNLVTPLLTAMIGITSLVTAAQWAWNAAQTASPTTWIVLGIVALIGVIALLVVKWDWVKEKGKAAWKGITDAAGKAWDWLKELPKKLGNVFGGIGDTLSRPFKAAFNAIADAWNSTVGGLNFSVPDWIPGIGGNSFSVPHMSRYHTGGVIPGPPGTEVPIIAMAGETVSLPGRDTGGTVHVTVVLDGDVLADGVARSVTRRGGRGPGNVQLVLGNG